MSSPRRTIRTLASVLALAAGFAIPGPARAAAADEITLRTVPATVYKARDPGRAPLESWLFHVVVQDARAREGLRPLRAELAIYSGPTLRETIVLPESTVANKRTTTYRVTAGMDTLAWQRRFTMDEAFDLRFVFLARPVAWRADHVRVTLTLAAPAGSGSGSGSAEIVETLDVPLRVYEQKTRLRFPLAGPVTVSQGTFNNGGHNGHSNQFALDFLALDDTYGPWAPGKTGNAEYAGWGREVLAPAAGTVVHARNDVPDNEPGAEPLDTIRTLPDPMLAVPGNCVVIDHGNGEYSALMHLQKGSVTVRVGDKVAPGQVVGRLGNSGDAFGPHLHYQLQDGPELLVANSLPARFEDVGNTDFARGSYFRPK